VFASPVKLQSFYGCASAGEAWQSPDKSLQARRRAEAIQLCMESTLPDVARRLGFESAHRILWALFIISLVLPVSLFAVAAWHS
jgi:hypothetical protein